MLNKCSNRTYILHPKGVGYMTNQIKLFFSF
nr:MAG TPA: hypothetical protein [Caudoviricetes sp.]DAO80650.1 MAG TPA: hypothetical protein [Caudoviricetes sp.]DAQ11551.1 MAG TPA: hypothetical protein [Caudoviricetes sp.]